jgi:hypothetical protein
VRLPSSGRRLIRGSIIDITERKRSELLTAGDRRVFERITSNSELTATLEAITETAEKVTPDALCTVSIYDAETNTLHHVAGMRLPHDYLTAKQRLEIGPRNGSCAAAIFLHRQVIVAEITRDALWEHLRVSRQPQPGCGPAGRRRSAHRMAACSARSRCISGSRAARSAATSN